MYAYFSWDDFGDNLVVGDKDNISTEAMSLEQKLGSLLIINDNVEKLGATNSLKRLNESLISDSEELENSAFDLLSVEIGLRVSVL